MLVCLVIIALLPIAHTRTGVDQDQANPTETSREPANLLSRAEQGLVMPQHCSDIGSGQPRSGLLFLSGVLLSAPLTPP